MKHIIDNEVDFFSMNANKHTHAHRISRENVNRRWNWIRIRFPLATRPMLAQCVCACFSLNFGKFAFHVSEAYSFVCCLLYSWRVNNKLQFSLFFSIIHCAFFTWMRCIAGRLARLVFAFGENAMPHNKQQKKRIVKCKHTDPRWNEKLGGFKQQQQLAKQTNSCCVCSKGRKQTEWNWRTCKWTREKVRLCDGANGVQQQQQQQRVKIICNIIFAKWC